MEEVGKDEDGEVSELHRTMLLREDLDNRNKT